MDIRAEKVKPLPLTEDQKKVIEAGSNLFPGLSFAIPRPESIQELRKLITDKQLASIPDIIDGVI